MVGSFLLGVAVTLVVERWPPTRFVRPFVAIGFCGGFTTFSTMVVEAAQRGQHGRVGLAAVYLAVSLVAGVLAAAVGIGRGPRPAPARRAAKARSPTPTTWACSATARRGTDDHRRAGGGRWPRRRPPLRGRPCRAAARSGSTFPLGILVVNLSGSFVLGVLAGSAAHHGVSATWLTVAGTGLIGAYTTFSTFTFDTVRLLESREWAPAAVNVVVSLGAGLGAAALGLALGSLT